VDYTDRYIESLRAKGRRYSLVDGQLFVRRERWIAPLGPAAQAYHLDRSQCRELLRKLGGLWVMWTDGFDSPDSGSDWHAVICRRHVPVEAVASGNTRSKLRRGLKNCEVRQVAVREIAQNGYETYCAALGDYGQRLETLPTADEFARRVMTDEPFGDIRHQWAVYHEGQMVGFAQNLLYGQTEVDYTLIKLHPEYLNRYSSYALFYRMNEHYLAQAGFQYVNDGFRSIAHETGIQDFLIKEFGFEKARTGLHVHFRPPVGQVLRMVRPFRGVATRLCSQTEALFEMDRCRTRPR
jgi:hypothetical protein